ncbi:MAG: sugar transferase [Muribaculaceae bacterium]|nr:sugar transferase [Muribaculaceae bacterium]
MFKKRNKTLRIAYVCSDVIMTSLAFFVFNILRFVILYGYNTHGLEEYLFSTKIVLEQFLVPIGLLFIYLLSGYYNNPFPRSRISEFLVTAGSAAVNALIIFMTLLINDPTPRRRTEYLIVVLLFLLFLLFTYSGRLVITNFAVKRAKKSNLTNKTIIITNREINRHTIDMVLSAKSLYRNEIAGIVMLDGNQKGNESISEFPLISSETLKPFCRQEKVSQIVLAPGEAGDKSLLRMVNEYIDLGIPIKIAPHEIDYAMAGIRTNDILGHTFIDLTAPRISDFSKNIKRLCDVMLSILVLIILSPFFIIIALMIKIDSNGPVFYTQERIGRHRLPFRIIKFRTMITDAEANGPKLSSDTDTRVTKVGRWLRKFRIDEIPQMINVIKGDMSIVGPRPEREFYIRQIVKRVPYFGLIYQVRPGITSWAMVKFGYASNLDQMVERTKFDMIYINNMSLLLDLKILLYTIKTVISGEGK